MLVIASEKSVETAGVSTYEDCCDVGSIISEFAYSGILIAVLQYILVPYLSGKSVEWLMLRELR